MADHSGQDGYYARVVRDRLTWTDPSELARRDDVRDALWKDSGDLVGPL